MLKIQKQTKFKGPHLYLSKKGLKEHKSTKSAIVIKTKETSLVTPQQREVCRRILSKSVREEYGALKILCFHRNNRAHFDQNQVLVKKNNKKITKI